MLLLLYRPNAIVTCTISYCVDLQTSHTKHEVRPTLDLTWLDVTTAIAATIAATLPPNRSILSLRTLPTNSLQYTKQSSHLNELASFLLRKEGYSAYSELLRLQERMFAALALH